MSLGGRWKEALAALGVITSLRGPVEADNGAQRLNEATEADSRRNPVVVDTELNTQQITEAALAGEGLSLSYGGPESEEGKVDTLTPPEPLGDLKVAAENEDPSLEVATEKPALATATPMEGLLQQEAIPPIIGTVGYEASFPVVQLDISQSGYVNIRSGPGIAFQDVGDAVQGELFILIGSETSDSGDIWHAVVPAENPSAETGYISSTVASLQETGETAPVPGRLSLFSTEQLAQMQQQAAQIAAERGIPLALITSYTANEPGMEDFFNKPVAVDTDGMIVMVYNGEWVAMAPQPFPGGREHVAFLLNNADLLSSEDAAAITEVAMAPYERLISTLPAGAVEIYMEPVGDLHYIWALGPDQAQLGLWNMTPDGGEWAELRIDSPNRETMANPEVFDQIPEHIKQSYLYSESLGGYFRVQRQRDGQNAIEVYMPRLVGFHDVTTNTTSEGWARLYDSFSPVRPNAGPINIFGVGDFTNREHPADFRGAQEGDDGRLANRIQAGFETAVKLIHQIADGEFNQERTTQQVQEALDNGTDSLQLAIPTDWETWLNNSNLRLDDLRLQYPNAAVDRTMRPVKGVNFVFLASVSHNEIETRARWLSPDIYTPQNEVGIATGLYINENGQLQLFAYHGANGPSVGNRVILDSFMGELLGRFIPHARPNPSVSFASGISSNPSWVWEINAAMEVAESVADANRIIESGDPEFLLDITPAPDNS